MENSNGKLFKCQIILFAWILSAICANSIVSANNKSESLHEFQYCLKKSKNPSVRECVGRTAISFLQRFDEKENFTLTKGFVASKDDKIAGRSLVNILDTDPVDIRGILENAGAIFSQRSLEWHMDAFYPGLMFKIGPSADANSVAQFVLDPSIDERNFDIEETSTARILTKQYILPLLLGLKFNLVALVPILFTVICLLLKKSLFIAKLVIYISSVLGIGGIAGSLGSLGGLGGLFAGSFGAPHVPPPLHHHGGHLPGSFGLYPGKNTVFSHYDQDDLQHTGPYKRQDRKVVFEKPRENIQNNSVQSNKNVRSTVATIVATPASVDHFYDYEKQVLMQDRSERMRHETNGKLGPSAYDEDDFETAGVINVASNHRFKTASESAAWKVVRL